MPKASPNTSQWNMGHVGYARVGFALGLYIYVVCVNFVSLGYPKLELAFRMKKGFNFVQCH